MRTKSAFRTVAKARIHVTATLICCQWTLPALATATAAQIICTKGRTCGTSPPIHAPRPANRRKVAAGTGPTNARFRTWVSCSARSWNFLAGKVMIILPKSWKICILAPIHSRSVPMPTLGRATFNPKADHNNKRDVRLRCGCCPTPFVTTIGSSTKVWCRSSRLEKGDCTILPAAAATRPHWRGPVPTPKRTVR